MQENLTMKQKGLVLISVPLLFQLLFVGTLIALQWQAEAEAQREAHAREVVAVAHATVENAYQAGMIIRGNTLDVTHDRVERFHAVYNHLLGNLDKLEQLVDKKAKYREVIHESREHFLVIRQIVDNAAANGQIDEGVHGELRNRIQKLADESMPAFLRCSEEAKEIERSSPQVQAAMRSRIVSFLLVGVAANIALSIILVLRFNRGTVDRLARVMFNTHRLVALEPLSPKVGGTDEIAQLDGVLHDVASALKAADDQRQQLELAKDQFLTMVSHDLRTPLTSIDAALNNVGEGIYGNLNERGQECVGDARTNLSRLIRMINDLLDAEQLRAGKLRIDAKPVSANELVSESIETVRDYAKQQQVNLVVSDNDEVYVQADRDRIIQVLTNLLSNAIKFSPKNSDIKSGCLVFGNQVELFVQDRGRGVPEEHRQSIFEPFVQVDASDAKRLRGAGVGLSICKSIIEGHGGTIGVEAPPEGGSRFFVRLPRIDMETNQKLVAAESCPAE